MSPLFWEQAAGALPVVFIVILILWVLLAVALHVGARLAGGTGGFGQTAAVAAWGLVPALVSVILSSAVLVAFAVQTDPSASSPETLIAQVRNLQSGISGLVLLLVQISGAAWQAFVWAGGLRAVHEISRVAAAATAVLVAAGLVLLA